MPFRKRPVPHPMILEDHWPVRTRPSLLRRILFAIAIGLLFFLGVSLVYANPVEENSLQTHIQNAQSGQLLLSTSAGFYQPALHLETDVQADIKGMVARVEYTQSFRNDSREWKEAVYLFPLSENAAVNEMEMILDDRIIRSEIREKKEAQRIYTEAKASGKRAAITEQQRPNMFTQKVANIAPGETIKVRLQFILRLDYDSGRFGFFLPTTITPRFIPGIHLASFEPDQFEPEQTFEQDSFGWAKPTDLVPDAHLITPFMLPGNAGGKNGEVLNPISININLQPGLELVSVKSRNHSIQQHRIGENYQIELGPVSMDRDFRLEWQPVARAMPQAAVFQESFAGDDYGLIMLMPPQSAPSNADSLAREVIFILDTSGSMSGNSINQAKQSLVLALERLKPADRFNLIEFNSNHSTLFYTPVAADNRNISLAKNWVMGLRADGGTQMAPALSHALDMPNQQGYLKQVVFITDGAVGNEAQLFNIIESKLDQARLFTVGIGSAPNSYFMTRAAQFGRGAYMFINNQAEVQERMSDLFRKLESAVMSSLQVNWQLSSKTANKPEQFPARVPDLYYGEPLILSVKSSDLKGTLQLSGTFKNQKKDQKWTRSIKLESDNKNTDVSSSISTVWAKAKVEALMDQKAVGRLEEDVRSDVLEVALPHKLVTAYSSLVAVEEKISRQPQIPFDSAPIPNAVAQGQKLQFQSYPRTSSSMGLSVVIGHLALTLALLMLVVNKRTPVLQETQA